MSSDRHASLGAVYLEACRCDVEAFKPGNVSLQSGGHGMAAADFVRSAERSVGALLRPGASLGERVYEAVEVTRRAVGCNTNLGIVLLAAPLLHAALERPDTPLREGVAACLTATDIADAEWVRRAIVLAAPGGLGAATEHDVAEPARLGLVALMQAAATRDRIAHLYATGFADLFESYEPYLRTAIARQRETERALVELYLQLLAGTPDTHIRRKHGEAAADQVMRLARPVYRLYRDRRDSPRLRQALMGLDARLKGAGLNPGTSADLCVATLISHRLLQQARTDTGVTRENPRIRPAVLAGLRHPSNSQ